MFFGLLIEQVEKPKKRIDFGHRSLNQQTINAFGDEINDLKAIYLNQCVVDNHFDYEGKSLKLICERDQGFIYEFFDHYSAKFRIGVGLPEWISKRFSFLFDSEDYNDQIEKVFILLSERFPVIGNFKNSVVVLFEDAIKDADRRNRAVKLIDQMLSEHFESTALTRSLFNVIVHCLREERIKYLIQFVELNNDKKCFDLVTEGFGHHEAVSGDWIPIYEEEMEFWETVLQDLRNLTPTVDYVHHIASVKKRIEYCQRSIQRQRKRDFTDFYRQ